METSVSKRKYTQLLLGLIIFTALTRLLGLGYSHFYGDETKVLYIDKTIPATQFFLDQRKGPVQFLFAWIMEKTTGGFSEFWIRFPFALASIAAVFVFYLLINKIFKQKNTALLCAAVFSSNGFSVAFGRTAQYQSFLMLFGFLGILLWLHWQENNRKIFLFLSSVSFVLAFLCHYDAIFYLVPVIVLYFFQPKFQKTLLFFILPLLVGTGAFYLPYYLSGYFHTNTVGYIGRRLVGSSDFLPNNSFHTYSVYNPLLFIALVLAFFIIYFFIRAAVKRELLKRDHIVFILWFLVPFIIFEFIFKNPGTHIFNYLIPLFVIATLGYQYCDKEIVIKNILFSRIFLLFFLSIVAYQAESAFTIFLPQLNDGYPWRVNIQKDKYQLFLYGFQYNRKWDEIAKILYAQKGIRGFYTNDNSVVAKYYVNKLDFTEPGTNFIPQYIVDVAYCQEYKIINPDLLVYYTQIAQLTNNGEIAATIYRLGN